VSLPDELWGRFGGLTVEQLPDDVLTLAKQCILDWYGCAVAGSREPLSAILREELGSIHGPCAILGVDHTTGVLQAALLNGAAGHALDFDDTHTTMSGHPTAPLFPAALASAQLLESSGADLLAAFVVGFEIECRLGRAIGPAHYAKGWHQTSTIGIFGATAAVSRLLRLGSVEFGHAIGLAASQSSGLKANFGTMTKPFHAGHAAERGTLSARLASRGFTSNPDALDGNQGLAQAAGSGELRWSGDMATPDDWLIRRNLFKYHAACYLTHAAMEATATALAGEPGAVGHVTITVNPSILDVCGIPRPRTGLEAKFSLAATTAFTVLGLDTTDPATFSDESLDDDELQRHIGRVTVETDSKLATMQAAVMVSTAAGPRTATHDSGVPATDLEAQGRKLLTKFHGLARPVVDAKAAAQIASRIDDLERLTSARELTAP
jgi:2-methylcitrate dehydratase PrpD